MLKLNKMRNTIIILMLMLSSCGFLSKKPYMITEDTFTGSVQDIVTYYWKEIELSDISTVPVWYVPQKSIDLYCKDNTVLACYDGKAIYVTAWQFVDSCVQIAHEYGHVVERILGMKDHEDETYYKEYIQKECGKYEWMDSRDPSSPFLKFYGSER